MTGEPCVVQRTMCLVIAWMALFPFTISGSHAATAQLININSRNVPQGSDPVLLGKLAGKIIFGAYDGTSSSLYSTDGTGTGTVLLKKFSGAGVFGSANQLSALISGSTLYFTADDGVTGFELWRTDGTAGGTVEVADVTPGPTGSNIQLDGLFGTQVLFQAYDGSQHWQLYITDGTAAGTHRLTNFTTQSSFLGPGYFAVGNKFYFPGGDYNDLTIGRLIYVSDGTSAGTHPVNNPYGSNSSIGMDATYGPRAFRLVGGLVLYEAGGKLWSIDTATDTIGSVQTTTGQPGFGPPMVDSSVDLADMNGYVLLIGSGSGIGNEQLYRSDGTSAGTFAVASIIGFPPPAAYYPFLEKVGNRVLFLGQDPTNGLQLWSSDGTAANTLRLTNAPQPANNVSPTIISLGVINATAYFTIADTAATDSRGTVWASDGTPAGTAPLPGLRPVDSGEFGNVRVVGDASRLYINVPYHNADFSSNGSALYRYDAGATSATLVRDDLNIDPNFTYFYDGGRLYFSNNDPQTGTELWTSDGTAGGTGLVANLMPDTVDAGSSPDEFVNFGGRLVFTADDGVSGRELWISDGSTGGTKLLADINPGPGSSNPNHLFVANGDLYLFATDVSGASKLMRVAAGATAPQVLATLTAANCSATAGVAFGGKTYFAATDGSSPTQLWTTDGTSTGTKPAFSTGPYSTCELVPFNNKIYFSGTANPDGSDIELWASDGSSAGTARVADIYPGTNSSNPIALQAANGVLYFFAFDGSERQWKTDGTPAGTVPAFDLPQPGAPTFGAVTGTLNGKLLILSWPPNPQPQPSATGLWIGDGTGAGTNQLSSSIGGGPVVVGGLAYFAANTTGVMQPWVTDGTVAGTHLLKDIQPTASTFIDWMVNFNGIVLFDVVEPAVGGAPAYKLWRTDGTEAGTVPVGDMPRQPPPNLGGPFYGASWAVHQLVAGQAFYFVGTDSQTGTELYALVHKAPTTAADSASSSNDAAVTINVLANDSADEAALDPSTVKITVVPQHGTATVGTGGTLTYTPNAGFSGTDTFSYTVADNRGAVSVPTNVTVTVTSSVTVNGSKGGGGGVMDWLDALVLICLYGLRKRKTH